MPQEQEETLGAACPELGPVSPLITGRSHPRSGVTYSRVPRIVRAPWTTHPSSHYSHSCLQGAPEGTLWEQPVPHFRESLTYLTCACRAVRVSLLSREPRGWTKISRQPLSENHCGPITAPSVPDRTPPSVGMLKQEQWLGNEDSRVLGEDFIYDRIIITVSS